MGLAPTAPTAFYASVDAQYPEFWENVGECGKYVFFTYVGLPQSLWNDHTREFIATFEERYGQTPGGPAMEAYDSAHMLLAAIDQAGSTEPSAIIEALENIKMTGVLGELWVEYGAGNPGPEGVPAWMWHTWPTPRVVILQDLEAGPSV